MEYLGCVQSSKVINRSGQSSLRVCLCVMDDRSNRNTQILDYTISFFSAKPLHPLTNLNFPNNSYSVIHVADGGMTTCFIVAFVSAIQYLNSQSWTYLMSNCKVLV